MFLPSNILKLNLFIWSTTNVFGILFFRNCTPHAQDVLRKTFHSTTNCKICLFFPEYREECASLSSQLRSEHKKQQATALEHLSHLHEEEKKELDEKRKEDCQNLEAQVRGGHVQAP